MQLQEDWRLIDLDAAARTGELRGMKYTEASLPPEIMRVLLPTRTDGRASRGAVGGKFWGGGYNAEGWGARGRAVMCGSTSRGRNLLYPIAPIHSFYAF